MWAQIKRFLECAPHKEKIYKYLFTQISKMLLNINALKVLEEFCLDYDKKVYGRQIALKNKMNQKTIANALNGLEKQGILRYFTEGRNKYYSLNKLNPETKEIIKMVEIARKNEFIEHHNKLKALFEELGKRAKGILIVFGSYANFTNKSDSDLDILNIDGSLDIEDIKDRFKVKINPVKIDLKKFNKEEVFIKEIIKNHVILKGVEDFVDLIW